MYFAKYMGNFDVRPIVLTVKPDQASYRYMDESLSEHVAHIQTHRTRTRELLRIYSLLRTGSASKGIPHGHVDGGRSLIGRLGNFIRSNFFVPDARVGWKRFATKEGRRIIRNEKVDVIITTGTPHSTHLIGMILKKEFGLPWLADFRDPWVELYYNKELKRLPFAWRKDKRLERDVLRSADVVLSAGPSLSALLAGKLPEHDRSKFHHILNGYDAEMMQGLMKQKQDRFTMTFIGLLTAHQPFTSILKALKRLSAQRDDFASRSTLAFAGTVEDQVFQEANVIAGLKVDYRGRVSHKESLQMMMNSQLLLNALPETDEAQLFITGKMMEYLATGNPILCIGPLDGDAVALLQGTTNSSMFAKSDEQGIARFVEMVFDKWSEGVEFSNAHLSQVKQHSRFETTRRLADLIKAM